ncbi:hypothetical protein [Fodinicola feengrottensis]|uniref:hypothetical protein n=1 Tax=Fodinicola feengrottensis TaxID=435914 RepID=UPI00244296E5|nr:hypothetical protein [Fodinicola feengrottensis]
MAHAKQDAAEVAAKAAAKAEVRAKQEAADKEWVESGRRRVPGPDPRQHSADQTWAAHLKAAREEAEAQRRLNEQYAANAAKNDANWAKRDAERAARDRVPAESLPAGVKVRDGGDTLVLYRGKEPVAFVPRGQSPSNGVLVFVDPSMAQPGTDWLAQVQQALHAIPVHRRQNVIVQFLGKHPPITPARAQEIANQVFADLPEQTRSARLIFATPALTGRPGRTELLVPIKLGLTATLPEWADAYAIHPTTRPVPSQDPKPASMRAADSAEAEYFGSMPQELSTHIDGKVILLFRGPRPTQPVKPRTSLTIVVDESVVKPELVAAAISQLRPEAQLGLRVEVGGDMQPVTPARANEIADQLLADTDAAVLFPRTVLKAPPPLDASHVPVDTAGNPTFAPIASGFLFARTDHPAPAAAPYGLKNGPEPGTFSSPNGLRWRATGDGEISVGRTLAPSGPAMDRPGTIVVGKPGNVLSAAERDEITRVEKLIRATGHPVRMLQVGRVTTAQEQAELKLLQDALPGYTVVPASAGFAIAPAGAVADPGVAGRLAPNMRVLFVNPAGANLDQVTSQVVAAIAALPANMRKQIAIQPVSGLVGPWRAIQSVADRLGGTPIIMPRGQAAGLPPADANVVPMVWTKDGPIRTVTPAADHFRVYARGTTPLEPLPAGLVENLPGSYGIDLPGLENVSLDATKDVLRIYPRGTEPLVPIGPKPPGLVSVEITGPVDLAQLYDLLENLSAGQLLDVTLDGHWGGLNAQENAAIKRSLPAGYTAHRVPAGHVISRDTDQLPDAIGDVLGLSPRPRATLIALAPGVPVGLILASLPSSIRDRAVIHRAGEPSLPVAWAPAYLRKQQSKEPSRAPVDAPRRTAVKLAVIRAAVAQMRSEPLVTSMPTVAPAAAARAVQLANLGHHAAAADQLATAYLEAADVSQHEMLRELGVAAPPPVRLGGGDGASPRHHANTAVMAAVRLTFAGELGGRPAWKSSGTGACSPAGNSPTGCSGSGNSRPRGPTVARTSANW